MRRSFIVTVDLPEETTPLGTANYIRDAVSVHCGSLRPPGGYGADDIGDPYFQFRHKQFTVKIVKEGKQI